MEKDLTTSVYTFEDLIKGNFLYVDKTEYIWQLIRPAKGMYFLSRPRRFGKSLLLSTLEAIFSGKKELFKGLALYDKPYEWKKHPIIHLSFGDYTPMKNTAEKVDAYLRDKVATVAESYSIKLPKSADAATSFGKLIDALHKKGQVVILVDEYDKPLLYDSHDKDLQDKYRRKLKSFYSIVKTMDEKIRFAFFTGVTKFSKVSVFSDLNNLKDISLDARFVAACGITEKEIHDYLDDEVGQMAEANGIDKNACYERLKKEYDGYHFRENSVGVYNPFSLINALDSHDFKDFWFETGTPTFLVETLKSNNYELENMTREEVTADLLGSLDSIDQNPLPLLYQSGYLTIKDYNPDFGTYTLGFPNGEVERGFSRFLFRNYAPLKIYESDSFVIKFTTEVRNGQPEKFMSRLEAMFANQDYQIVGDTELYFHNVTSLVFKMLGFYTEVERHTTDGRMDMLVQTKDYIYIFEFKIDKSADEALAQIEEKQYAKPFEQDPRKLYKIGVNFSTSTRRIESWKVIP